MQVRQYAERSANGPGSSCDEARTEADRGDAGPGTGGTLCFSGLVPTGTWRSAPTCTTGRPRGQAPTTLRRSPRAKGGVPDERLVGDVEAAGRCLTALESSNGKLATIGYCSGGRQSFLAACSLPLAAAVVCYGAYIVGSPPAATPLKVGPLVHLAGNLSCPLLGLFGAEDRFPTPQETAELAEALRAEGKTFEFHTFDGAGHGFFATDRPSYRPAAATEGWQKIWEFFGRYLQT